jgi:signal transduction histidine kinase
MKIKNRLTLIFTILVVGILFVFSFSIYAFYQKHRQEDFIRRLHNKAINTVVLLNTAPIDSKVMKIIDHRTVTNMEDFTLIILDSLRQIQYTNKDSKSVPVSLSIFQKLNWDKNNSLNIDKKLYVAFPYHFQNKKFYLLSSANDAYGEAELQQLLIIMLIVFIASLTFVIIAGNLNATQSLKPIKDIISQVDEIEASNLNIMLKTKNKDEIAELAHTFNKMLERINKAFDRERFFVSNASHELRTPVTSIKGQVEVALLKDRDESYYVKTLTSILDDVENMSNIINGFLQLAETNTDLKHLLFEPLQIDEFLFGVKDEILKRKPSYVIHIEFLKTPDKESEITVMGNHGLMAIMMSNLIDNACKFSENNKVVLKIDFDDHYTIIQVVDNGMGIPNEEIQYVFQPLYRAGNVHGKFGSGIGLSIVQRIAELHKAQIQIMSEINTGTTVTVMLPKS